MLKFYINESDESKYEKVFETIIKTIKEFYEEFSSSVRTINCRYSIDQRTTGAELYIDYFALRPTYTKEDTKKALAIFNKYANIITMYLDVLKMEYPNLEYCVEKTQMSSARIGKCLIIENFPFKVSDEYKES